MEEPAKVDTRTCPNCGAGRAEQDGLTHCGYCGFEFLSVQLSDGINIKKTIILKNSVLVMSNDFKKIIEQVKESNSVQGIELLGMDNFMCKDWSLYYNLYNPENFEDPDDPNDWYDAEDIYEYYEIPFTSGKEIDIFSEDLIENLDVFEEFLKNSEIFENKILTAFVDYTFNNGGAYAAGKFYNYAKKTMEKLHQVKMTNEEFMKRNLCINSITLKNSNEIEIDFHCSWDMEHGVTVKITDNKSIKIE